MDPIPRIRMVAPEPGFPLDCITCTPDICPERAPVTFATALSASLSESTADADPVKEDLVAVPYATTIVSSSISVSGASRTSSTPIPETGISTVTYPIEENIRTPSEGTSSENFPSPSVLAPVIVSLSCIEANGTGRPLEESVTVPVTVITS